MIVDDDEMEIIVKMDEEQKDIETVRYGKGNAIGGVKSSYSMYPPSNVVNRVM